MTTDFRNTNAPYFGQMAQSRVAEGDAVAAALWARDATSIAFGLRPDLRLCFQCKPWPDGGCDFGCPCSDCDEGRKYEAFVTNPNRETPSAAECQTYFAYLRGGEVGRFDFEDEDGHPEDCDGCSDCRAAEERERREFEREHSAERLG